MACTGATPLAITNCLNFGNPLKPEVFHQFREAVLGMGEACEALGTPVTGGNVSFYNESPAGAVYPTPVVGMVGLIDDVTWITRAGFRDPGEAVLLLGPLGADLGGSEYLKVRHGLVAGEPPDADLDLHRELIRLLLGRDPPEVDPVGPRLLRGRDRRRARRMPPRRPGRDPRRRRGLERSSRRGRALACPPLRRIAG